MKIKLKMLSKGISYSGCGCFGNWSGTLYHKSCNKPIERDLARYALLHNMTFHVIRNDDIHTLQDRSFDYDESTVCELLEKSFSSCIPISRR